MKLFLASLACQSLDLVRPLLPTEPKKMKIAFIPTASDTYRIKPWIVADRLKLMSMGFRVTDYDIKNKSAQEIKQDLSEYDGIFVCGGNTFYLLHVLRKSGGDQALIDLIRNGKLYIGSSAGSCILCPDLDALKLIDHPEEVPELKSTKALHIISERLIPHAGRDKYRERHTQIRTEWGDKVIFLTDDQAIIVDGNRKYMATME